MKRIISSLLMSVLFLSTLSLNGVQASNLNKIDAFLIETGMPTEIVNELDEDLKKYIYETTESTEKLTFSGYNEQEITFPDTGENIQPSYISTDELYLGVTAFRESSGVYKIYPTFEWHNEVKVGNDSFAFALPPGWKLEPGKYNLRLWEKGRPSDRWMLVEDFSRPSIANFYGYAWKFPKTYTGRAYARGNAYFYATPTTSRPDRRICITYADDITSGLKASYGLKYGALSVTVSNGKSSEVREGSDILDF